MSIFGKIIAGAVETALLPVDIARGVLTLGESSNTEDRIDSLKDNADRIMEELKE